MRRSKFNLSHSHLLTCDMGKLVPIGCVEALPGDTFQHSANVLVRVSPLAAPVMHPVTARVHHFFVPNRILWEGWEEFITGGPDGLNADNPPTVTQVGLGGQNNVLDYLGVPLVEGLEINALPLMAYNAIYNEFYRDQDLVEEASLGQGVVHNIAWEKDYFTSARPWPQKGSDVTIPLGDRAWVKGIGFENATFQHTNEEAFESGTAETRIYENAKRVGDGESGPGDKLLVERMTEQPLTANIYADLANATGANINDVRKAFAIQRYQEARARYGSRYTEYLRYLGVTPADARLQRPEYLGGGHTQINFSEILQTAPETQGDPHGSEFGVGDLYGHGIAAMRSNAYRRFIEEHGFIVSMLSVRPKAMYQDAVHKQFYRKDKEDYFQKELQHIGQQEVLNKEVFPQANADDEEVFGYQDRYMDYKEYPSHVSGDFRDTLNYWHMARDLGTLPSLNEDFVKCEPTKRIHNEQNEHALWVSVQHKMVARRLLSRSAAPKVM
jgi:hypothetical protein